MVSAWSPTQESGCSGRSGICRGLTSQVTQVLADTKGPWVHVVQLSGAPGEREMCGNNSGVHSAADFKGKTLGVTDLGSGTDELTQFLASQHGITRKDYHTLAVGAGATAIAAIQRTPRNA